MTRTTTPTTANRGLLIEALVASGIVMTVALVLDPTAPGRGVVHPHLLWIAVLVLAAQYGMRGLLAGLGTNVVTLSLASLVTGEGLGWLVDGATSGSELLALSGAIAVAWVAGGHARRKATLQVATAERTAQATEATTAFGELRTVANGLVRQIDRAQLSISYLRSLAQRIEGDNLIEGADAAIELALGRTGARVGAILLHDGSRLRLFAHRGMWSSKSMVPPDMFSDRTAALAFARGRTATCLDLGIAEELDSDVAAPIFDSNGKACGVIIVRGLEFDIELASIERYQSTLAELVAVAGWVARPLAKLVVTPAVKTGYSHAFRAGERRDVIVMPRPANDRNDAAIAHAG